MAVIIKTNTPEELLKLIKKAIDEGDVVTWSYDDDGDFTHTPNQWKYKAWLKPEIYDTELRLGIIKRNDEVLSKEIYGVYHGRFIEMVLVHFDGIITFASGTANKTDPDNF